MTVMPIKLRAVDADDVEVISSILQDSIVPLCDISYRPEDHGLIMVVQRLRREHEMEAGSALERVCCAVTIRGVEQVQTQNLDFGHQARMLDLLAMLIDGNVATLIFAGDAKIRLQLGSWSMFIEDFGEPWPAACNPCHDNDVVS